MFTLDAQELLSVPEVADLLGVRQRDVRTMISEGSLVGLKSEGTGFAIPRQFFDIDVRGARALKSLRGTVTTLRDTGLADNEIVEWLMTNQPELGGTPVEILRSGNVHSVRKAALLA